VLLCIYSGPPQDYDKNKEFLQQVKLPSLPDLILKPTNSLSTHHQISAVANSIIDTILTMVLYFCPNLI
jgi:hypothetical protein